MHTRVSPVVVLGLAALVWSSFVPPAAAGPPAGADRSGRIEVMTRNLYVGADIFRVFDATTPDELPIVVAGILQTVFDTDFPARSDALADEIARHRPHLIGLQEVSLIRVQSPGDFLLGNPQPAETELFDYLDLLLARLAERGLDYRVAAVVENADVELPFLAGIAGGVPQLDDIRLTDRDVILARGDVDTSDALARSYAVHFSVPFGPLTIDFLRGFTAVDATVHGRTVRFVNTHLEVESIVPIVQQAQTAELLAELAAEELPVVLVGDFNSSPDDPFPAPYGQLAAAGFTDTWLRRLGRPEDGATCCFTETLDDPSAALTSRIDLVWARTGSTAPPFDAGIGPVRAVVVGDALRDRTDTGLWPSDHAGVVSSMVLRLPR
ncbi:MAG: endonuclease/exonuclease/phosphatase family protein [Acidobacteriota bacterium]|jgi:hypothetical protein